MQLNVALLRSTFDAVKPRADVLAKRFYEKLFADDPQFSRLFVRTDVDEQRQKLVQSLVLVVKWLDQPDRLTRYLIELGGRHVDYRVHPEHYVTFTRTLVETLGECVGPAWNRECEAAWSTALEFVADVMLQGSSHLAGTGGRLEGWGAASDGPHIAHTGTSGNFRERRVGEGFERPAAPRDSEPPSGPIPAAERPGVPALPANRQSPSGAAENAERGAPSLPCRPADLELSKAILQQIPVNVLVVDSELRLIYANAASRAALHALEDRLPGPVDGLIGQKVDFLLNRHADLRSLFANRQSSPHRMLVRLGNDAIDLTIAPIRDAEGGCTAANVIWSLITDQSRLVGDLERDIQSVTTIVRSSTTQTQSSARTMAASAEVTAREAQNAAAASHEATRNAQMLCTSGAQLSASIAGIIAHVQTAFKLAGQLAIESEQAQAAVKQIGEASCPIGHAVKSIAAIGQHANLLGLNAMIEAARAGEAGKGFAVIGGELKDLAGQIVRMSDEIGQRFESLKQATRTAVTSLGSIGGLANRTNALAGTIVATLEEQAIATDAIARHAGEFARGTAAVAACIAGVSHAADETGRGASDVLLAAEGLSHESGRLDASADLLLDRLRQILAAETERSDRASRR